MFWKWMKENHPIINEVVWWVVIVICVITLFF